MSILQKLRQYIYTYSVRHSEPREAAFLPYQDLRKVIILYESDYLERNTLIRQLSTALQDEGKTVCLWGYVDKKEISSLILPVGRVLGARDINIFQRPAEKHLHDLQAESFDLLIDLTQSDCLPLRYLALYCPATFKTGARRADGVLDFMVDMPPEETPQPLFEQIIRYLKAINKG